MWPCSILYKACVFKISLDTADVSGYNQKLMFMFVSQVRWWTVLWSMSMEIMQRRCCGPLGWLWNTSGSSGKTSSWTWCATVSGATTSWTSLSSPTPPCTRSSGQFNSTDQFKSYCRIQYKYLEIYFSDHSSSDDTTLKSFLMAYRNISTVNNQWSL